MNKDDLLYFSFFLLELIIFFPTDGLIFCFLLIINLWDWPGWYRTLFFLAFLKRIQAQHSQSHKIILEATKLRCKSREDLSLRVLQRRTCSSFFLFTSLNLFPFSPLIFRFFFYDSPQWPLETVHAPSWAALPLPGSQGWWSWPSAWPPCSGSIASPRNEIWKTGQEENISIFTCVASAWKVASWTHCSSLIRRMVARSSMSTARSWWSSTLKNQICLIF